MKRREIAQENNERCTVVTTSYVSPRKSLGKNGSAGQEPNLCDILVYSSEIVFCFDQKFSWTLIANDVAAKSS